jgi:type IV pilus assembly protein PilW
VHQGFGLVEIMVALVIGMLAVIIMLQVFAQSEERKRISTSGGDAQTNGIIGFYQMQSDIGQAGYGISGMNLFACSLNWKTTAGTNIAAPVTLGPVTINSPSIPPGDANTDTVLVMYGTANGQPQGSRLVGHPGGNEYNIGQVADTAFAVGDRVIAAADTCSAPLLLDQVTQTDTGPVIVQTGTTGTSGANALYNLGPTPHFMAYAVRGGNLTACDFLANDCSVAANTGDASVWVPIASNIVSLKATYIKDTTNVVPGSGPDQLWEGEVKGAGSMDGIADAADQLTPMSACGWVRVSAINFAIVARSAQLNADPVNAPPPTWTDDVIDPIVSTTGALGPNMPNVDEPWKHYRYRVFEAVVPLRNVGWMGVPTGC